MNCFYLSSVRQKSNSQKPVLMKEPAGRFPPPWTVEDNCYIVKDRNAQALAYVYYEHEPGRRTAANLPTRDEARWIAANIVAIEGQLRRFRAALKENLRLGMVPESVYGDANRSGFSRSSGILRGPR